MTRRRKTPPRIGPRTEHPIAVPLTHEEHATLARAAGKQPLCAWVREVALKAAGETPR